ncbi:MAG: hypothetical protein HGA38_02395 [Candidatus Moranbacteria bacterium]|nr:hypothetical protein [Candidatus Moranbacteria bacterium]
MSNNDPVTIARLMGLCSESERNGMVDNAKAWCGLLGFNSVQDVPLICFGIDGKWASAPEARNMALFLYAISCCVDVVCTRTGYEVSYVYDREAMNPLARRFFGNVICDDALSTEGGKHANLFVLLRDGVNPNVKYHMNQAA